MRIFALVNGENPQHMCRFSPLAWIRICITEICMLLRNTTNLLAVQPCKYSSLHNKQILTLVKGKNMHNKRICTINFVLPRVRICTASTFGPCKFSLLPKNENLHETNPPVATSVLRETWHRRAQIGSKMINKFELNLILYYYYY